MKLIIEKETSIIFNTFEYSGEGLSAQNFLENWTNVEGKVIVPEMFIVVDLPDFEFTQRLVAKDGFRSEFKYDFENEVPYETQVAEQYLVENKIKEYTEKLTTTDYKIVKAYEASLVNKDTEYNFEEVHNERQLLRDKINELQNLLAVIQNDKK